MKKIITFLMIIGMILSFNINVYAEGEKTTESDTSSETSDTKEETKTETKEEDKEKDKEEQKTEEKKDEEKKEEKPNADTTNDKLKSDATIKNVTINGVKVVCTELVCKREIIDNETKSVKVTFELTNSKATADPKSGFEKSIKEGENTFEVKVTSEDKTKTSTYKFIITKKVLSTNSSLKRLIVNGHEIELKEGEQKYKTTVSYATKKLEIAAIPSDEKTKVIDFKNNKASFDFFDNSKDIKIKVQSEAGDMMTYTVTVTKRSEADVTLKSLTVKNYDIDFNSEVNDYEIKVLKNVDKLDIKAEPNSKDADIKITNPKLTVGENEVKIEVSNDGSTNTYTIKVTKLNEDDKTLANLKSLTIENYELEFKPDKYEYDLKIEDENHLIINALAKNTQADVEITGNLDLEDGSIIKIKVTYDGEFSNVYKINISKEGSTTSKKKVSKAGAIIVILFDIIAIIVIGIAQVIGKNKNNQNNNSNNNSNKDDEIVDLKSKNTTTVRKTKKENNIIDNLDDDLVDII